MRSALSFLLLLFVSQYILAAEIRYLDFSKNRDGSDIKPARPLRDFISGKMAHMTDAMSGISPFSIWAKGNCEYFGSEMWCKLAEDGCPWHMTLSEIHESLITASCDSTSESDNYGFAYTCTSDTIIWRLIGATFSLFGNDFGALINNLSFRDAENLPGNCSYANRPNYDNPRITFGKCDSAAMMRIKIAALIQSADDSVNVVSYCQDMKRARFDKDHHFSDKTVGDTGVIDLGGREVRWIIANNLDSICVYPTKSITEWPTGCMYLQDPAHKASKEATTKYRGNKCYQRIKEESKNAIHITGPIVECTKSILLSLVGEKNPNAKSSSQINMLYEVQQTLRNYVKIVLLAAMILFGLKIVLSPGETRQGDILATIFKFVLVVYFSLGIQHSQSGVSKIVLPTILTGMEAMSKWVAKGSSGFCDYTQFDYKDSSINSALWDSLDCRLNKYLGLNLLYDVWNLWLMTREHSAFKQKQFTLVSRIARVGGSVVTKTHAASMLTSMASIPPYLIAGALGLKMGNMQLLTMGIAFPVLVILLFAYIVQIFIVSMLCVVILGILAPLFIPMALLPFTKSYFQGWANAIIGIALHPVIVLTFAISIFGIYDYGFNRTCKFHTDMHEIVEGPKYVDFVINDNENAYSSPEEYKECTTSLGFIIDGVLRGWWSNKRPEGAAPNFELKSTPDIFGAKVFNSFFVKGFIMSISEIMKWIYALLTAILCLYIGFHCTNQIDTIASELTGGIKYQSQMSVKPADAASQVYSHARLAALKGGDQGKAPQVSQTDPVGSPQVSQNTNSTNGGGGNNQNRTT